MMRRNRNAQPERPHLLRNAPHPQCFVSQHHSLMLCLCKQASSKRRTAGQHHHACSRHLHPNQKHPLCDRREPSHPPGHRHWDAAVLFTKEVPIAKLLTVLPARLSLRFATEHQVPQTLRPHEVPALRSLHLISLLQRGKEKVALCRLFPWKTHKSRRPHSQVSLPALHRYQCWIPGSLELLTWIS